MKLRSAPLDEIFQELQVTLDQDGGWLSRLTHWAFIRAYRLFKKVMLLALRFRWRIPQQSYPPIGHEPFNIAPEELQQVWGQE